MQGMVVDLALAVRANNDFAAYIPLRRHCLWLNGPVPRQPSRVTRTMIPAPPDHSSLRQ